MNFFRGNILGSYLHGLFDRALGGSLIQLLLREKGMEQIYKILNAGHTEE